jgi:hypothetical protein
MSCAEGENTELVMSHRTRPPKVIKAQLKPIINLSMELVKLITDFLFGHTGLKCFHFGRGTVFVCPADVERIAVQRSTVTGVDIS